METVTNGGRARHAARKLIALVRRDYERICKVTLPGPNARGFYFPAEEIWIPYIRERAERCKTPEARDRLNALLHELAR